MKLKKSKENVLISGLLGGIGEYFRVDPTKIRIGFVVFVLLTGGPYLIPLYIIGAVLVPKADPKNKKNEDDEIIDKSSIDEHNADNISEIKEDDWSDF